MKMQSTLLREVRTEASVCEEWVPLAGARVLELGCGKAEATRELAQRHPDAQFIAQEVDTIQHGLNLAATVPPNVKFALGGAQEIPAPDGSYDAVLMFKSLHHVPVELMERALGEIHRVLAPGGIAFFAEPVFDGEYNEVIRIFHDEERVRTLAFAALERAVGRGQFELVTEQFFDRRARFDDFAHFEKAVIGVTHTQHRLTPAQYEAVREKFSLHMTPSGAEFRQPMRADVLRKRATD